jgi:GT2 family glycosyltransferase
MFEHWWWNETIDTLLITGFCMATERAVFNELGGFDERFFLGNEDLDFCWNLKTKRHKILIAPDTFIFHEGHQSFTQHSEELVREGTPKLIQKLEDYYGKGNVPSPEKIWGCNPLNDCGFTFNSNAKAY